MNRTRIAVLTAVMLLAVGIPLATSFPSAAGAPPPSPRIFVAHLSAAPGVSSHATGEAIFQLSPDGKSLSYRLVVSNINNVFMAHIHLKGGDILVWLYPNPNTVASGGEAACVAVLSGGSASSCPGYVPGRFDGVLAQGTITASDLNGSTTCYACSGLSPLAFSTLVSDMEAGQTFVNVHTTQNPGGEIQGTILAHPSHPGRNHLRLESSLNRSAPDKPVDGIPGRGAPWTVTAGQAGIPPNGMLHADGRAFSSKPVQAMDGTT